MLRVWPARRFDLAEQFQTPVFVMSDLDLGMNNWMSDPFKYPEKPINRGKVLTQGGSRRARRVRALQGRRRRRHSVPHAARHRSSGRVRISRAAPDTTRKPLYRERPDDLRTQHGSAEPQVRDGKLFVPRPDGRHRQREDRNHRATARSHWALDESRDQLRQRIQHRDQTTCRLRAYPFTREVHEFVAAARPRLRRRAEPRRARCSCSAQAGSGAGDCTTPVCAASRTFDGLAAATRAR